MNPPPRHAGLRNAPIDELAISVQLAGPRDMSAAEIGMFWGRLRQDFPTTQEHEPLPDIDLAFLPAGEQKLEFRFQANLDARRQWFLDSSESWLIQIQPRRVGLNWRRLSGKSEYPGFETVLKRFSETCEALRATWSELGVADQVPAFVELSYFDVFAPRPGSTFEDVGSIGRVLRPVSDAWTVSGLGAPVEVSYGARFEVAEFESGAKVELEASPAIRLTDRVRVLRVCTTVRVQLRERGWDRVTAVLEGARDIAHKCFTESLTSTAYAELDQVSK